MKSLLLLLPLLLQTDGGFVQPFEVSVRVDADGREFCTIDANQTSADRIVGALARELSALPGHDSVVVEGFTPPLRAAIVTVRLEDRDIDTALEWVLGSVDLDYRRRPGVISVFRQKADDLDEDALTTKAMIGYVRATRRFADHPLAATARMHQGRIEDERGNLSAALSHYEAVQENYRDSHRLPEAVWRRGLVMERMGSWTEANLAFRTLANLDVEHEWHASARLEMARCALELGDPLRARHILAALRESHPATTHTERTDRRLISARAELESGHAMSCLRALDPVLGGKTTDMQRAEVFEMQALAFEALDMPSEAAWAWQVRSDTVEGEARILALENAARLSLEAGEELNVLFLEKLAEKAGAAERLGPFVLEASTRLGFGAAGAGANDADALDTIERARKALDADDVAEASRILEPVFRDRDSLTDEQALALFPLWGRCLANLRGIDAATRMLSRARGRFEDLEQRRQIDLAAAALLEEYELFERAVEAYEGRYR